MRHRVSGRHLNRTAGHRRSLRRNMGASLIQHGAIRTTEAKAKELRRFMEKLITTAKKGTLHARRQVIAALGDREMINDEGELEDKSVVQKLFDEIAPRYADRPGGYTRIIRLSDRRIGDSGRQVLLQLVEETSAAAEAAQTTSRRKRRAAKRLEAADAAGLVADRADQAEADQAAAADKDAEARDDDEGAADEKGKQETQE